MVDPFAFFSQQIARANPPAPHVPDWVHKELADIDGLHEFGEPIFRLVWGGEATKWGMGRIRIKYPVSSKDVAIGWEVFTGRYTRDGKIYKRRGVNRKPETLILPISCANNPQYGVGRLVYDWLDIGKPRFFLEEWTAQEVACENWEMNRWGPHPRTGVRIDILGPPPVRGLYRPFLTIETDAGAYRAPDRDTVDWLRQIIYLRNQEPALYSKRERPPLHVYEAVLRKKYAQIHSLEVKEEDDLADRFWQARTRSQKLLIGNPNKGGAYGGLYIIQNPAHGTEEWKK